MEFAWDETKRRINLLKHRVDFADAVGVFYAVTAEDPDHHNEQRFITVGLDFRLQVDDRIRIISARKANHKERTQYAGDAI